jgi:hypothetical protein
MSRFTYDQFPKDYLKQLLSPLGNLEISCNVSSYFREIDVWFVPDSSKPKQDTQLLGLLGRFATTKCIFEPFRKVITPNDVRSCMAKLLALYPESQDEANEEDNGFNDADYPRLWLLIPTVSPDILQGFSAIPDEEKWPIGVYLFAEYMRTAIVAINDLPCTEETLWLRILGKGNVQKQAISEIAALPTNHPLRNNVLLLLADLQATLEANQYLDPEEQELMMELSPLILQWQTESAVN